MCLLLRGEMCVCDIEEVLGLSQTNVSRHLCKLSSVGLVDSRKKAQWVYYRISDRLRVDHSLLFRYLRGTLAASDAGIGDYTKLERLRKGTTRRDHKRCHAQ